jgi:hypothetical protein
MGRVVTACLGLAMLVAVALAAPGTARTRITVWAQPTAAQLAAYGGAAYGGFAPTTGALITEQREVDVAPNGEVRIAGVASSLDAASVQLRDLAEPGVAITEQRFVPGASTPTELLQRHIGDQVTIVTTKGDVTGTLRSADEQTLVVETAGRLAVMRRDGYVQDVRLPGGALDKPTLVWRLATKKPGKHGVEISYRTDGITWSADYLAVLDDSGGKLDFSAWATIKNTTTAAFDGAEITLVSGGNAATAGPTAASLGAPRRFTLKAPVKIGANDSVQVELAPPRTGAKVRSVVAYEAMADPSSTTVGEPNLECTSYNGSGMGTGRAEVAVELDVPAGATLPDGRVRLFRRHSDRLEVVSEDQLHAAAGVARVRVGPSSEVVGERRAITCNVDEQARTMTEKLEVRVENKGKQAVDVVIREFMWRWLVWRIDAEDRKGATVTPQTHEYRLRVPSKGAQTVTNTVVYTW